VFWACRGMGWRDVRSLGVCILGIMGLGRGCFGGGGFVRWLVEMGFGY
jgi:hypothetical protein